METNNQNLQSNLQEQPEPTNIWFDKKHIITYTIVLVGLTLIGGAIYAYQKQIRKQPPTDNLAGMDANNNGVRDDIDKYIADNYIRSTKTMAAATQYAAAVQKFLLVGGNNSMIGLGSAVACMHYVRPADSEVLTKNIETQTLNTKERTNAYNNNSAALSGNTFDVPSPSQWKTQCNFDPDKLESSSTPIDT